MRLQNNGSAAIRARNTALVHKAPRRRRRAAHHNLVLGARRRQAGVVAAALALAVEEVVVAAVLEDVGALERRRHGVVRHLVRRHAARERQRRAGLHLRLVQVVPERAPRQVVRPADVEQVRVDRVVRLCGRGLDAC